MHSECSAFQTFPVMLVMGYNNSYMDRAAVPMSWTHSSQPCVTSGGQTTPKQGLPPNKTLEMRHQGLEEGTQGQLNPSSQPNLHQPSINRASSDLNTRPRVGWSMRWCLVPHRVPQASPPKWGSPCHGWTNLQQREQKTQMIDIETFI